VRNDAVHGGVLFGARRAHRWGWLAARCWIARIGDVKAALVALFLVVVGLGVVGVAVDLAWH
jgi:hypothetical protein